MGEAKRKRERLLNGPCVCGSGKPGRACCYDGSTYHKKAAVLGLRNLPQGSSMARCYMAELNSCVGPISGEHLITKSVMVILADDGEFTIGGLPWQETGALKSIGFNSLTANCLCKEHNSRLHPLDDAAKAFFGVLRTSYEDDQAAHRSIVSGHDIERWLLKTLKALAVSGNLAHGGQKLSGAFGSDIRLIDMLDDPSHWPEGTGLYGIMTPGEITANYNRFQLAPLTKPTGEIYGLWTSIIGLTFVLLLEPIDLSAHPELAGAVHRPGQIRIQRPDFDSWIAISWANEGLYKQTLTLHFLEKLDPDLPNPYAIKRRG